MKILVFIEQSTPNRFWEAAVPMLRKSSIDVAFATLRPEGPLSCSIREFQVPVTSFEATNSYGYPSATMKLASLVRKERFDIIHACESIPAAISGLSSFIARSGIRLFHRQHNACPQKTKVFHNIANKTSDFTMACSQSTMNYAHRIDNFNERRIMVAYNGVKPLVKISQQEIDKIRNGLQIPQHARVISIVARLREEKGHLTLFEAAEMVSRTVKEPLHIVVTGDGYYENELRTAADKIKGITVHFTGHQENIAPWFDISDLVVMPSYSEPFGLVAAEAMSLGKPLIASAVGGLVEVVEDGVSGILVQPKDPTELASGIERILHDTELAKSLGEEGPKRVAEKFTMEKMVEGWIRCYDFVLKN